MLIERERRHRDRFGDRGAAANYQIEPAFRAVARLDRPILFEAIDDEPVDLIFLLLAPPDAGAGHLKALARVSRLLRDRATCQKLRGAANADALYALLTEPPETNAA